MSLSRGESFADHPKSERYWKLLNGGSVTSVRLDRGAAVAANTAGKMAKAFKSRRSASKERKRTQEGIERGEIKDIS